MTATLDNPTYHDVRVVYSNADAVYVTLVSDVNYRKEIHDQIHRELSSKWSEIDRLQEEIDKGPANRDELEMELEKSRAEREELTQKDKDFHRLLNEHGARVYVVPRENILSLVHRSQYSLGLD